VTMAGPKRLQTWAMIVLACVLMVQAGAQNAASGSILRGRPVQTPDGHFPPGYLYTAADLPRLVGRQLPTSGPNYLIGKFTYLGDQQGQAIFTPFSFTPAFPTVKTPSLKETTVLRVRFHDNVPRKLRVGAVIAPNPRSPLTLKRVIRASNGALLAEAEYWGTP
jgi:hypothetical protein